MSQSVHQRWRERPRCPALRVTPGRRGGVVHAIVGRVRFPSSSYVSCAGGTRRPRARSCVRIHRNNQSTSRTAVGLYTSWIVLDELSHCRAQFRTCHHRAFDAGAVLGIVNALRSASTRPTARPSGIDDASARHGSGNCAMVATLLIARMMLTRESARRMLATSRQCRTALPPFADTANGARIRPAPTGHGIERKSSHTAVRVRQPRGSVGHIHELRTS
jgi:hypothetical protein